MKKRIGLLCVLLVITVLAGCREREGSEADTETEAKALQSPGPLSVEELAYFTEYLNRDDNYGFLCSDYDVATDVDLNEVFYSGAGIAEPPEQEVRLSYEWHVGEINTDVVWLTREQVERFVKEKTGYELEEFRKQLQWPWLEEYGGWMTEHGDTNRIVMKCDSGQRGADGSVTLLCSEDAETSSGWIVACQVTLRPQGETWLFCSNKITAGSWLDAQEETSDAREETADVREEGETEFAWEHIADFDTSADISHITGFDQWGDWSLITKESLYGIWYRPGEEGGSPVVLTLGEEGAYVYYPLLDLYGQELYDWEVEDRSERGLCPALKIDFMPGAGPLSWYIGGLEDRIFWCNSQQEIFYKQEGKS